MQLSLIIGVGFTVLSLTAWIVGMIVVRRHDRSSAPLASADRDAVLRAQSLHEQATAGQMAAMASAQRQ